MHFDNTVSVALLLSLNRACFLFVSSFFVLRFWQWKDKLCLSISSVGIDLDGAGGGWGVKRNA